MLKTNQGSMAKNSEPVTEKPLGVHYKVSRVAWLMDKEPRFIKGLIKDGLLEGFRIGNEIVVSLSSINAYLEMCRITGVAKENADAEPDDHEDVG
jgi:hypothetical protein